MVDIRKQILQAITSKNEELLKYVNEELDLLEVTESTSEGTNLEHFYKIWQENKGKVGTKNVINSWIAYAIGMTLAKPDGDFLPERRIFARPGFPDIDSDFDYFHQEKVYNYIIDKYGRDKVANIGTYQSLKMRSSIRRIGKALDIAGAFHKDKKDYVTDNEQKVSEIIKSLPSQYGAKLKVKDENGKTIVIETIQKAYKYCDSLRYYLDKYPLIMHHAKNVEGLLSIYSVHPSGIIISRDPLERMTPIRKARDIGFATQYTYEDLEEIGIIKFDILAISTLAVVDRAVKGVEDNYGIKLVMENLPFDDEKTLALYRTGKLAGVFQCETGGMQHVMRQIKIDRFDEIMAAIALFRPGPLESIPEYCARKNGEKEITYFHASLEPLVKPCLKNTYGVAVFQEQIMQICKSVADFSVLDGYVVIKAIGKKKKYLIDRYRQQFIDGAVKNSVPREIATQYWDKFIVPFSAYGFCQSHAASYAFLSYMCAYLKANYTEEFMCAVLNVENFRKSHEKVVMMEKDLSNFEIKLLPMKINSCEVDYRIVRKKDVASGIKKTEMSRSIMCKGVGFNTAVNIVNNKPYENLRELAAKTDFRIVDQDTIACLFDGGFFNAYVKQYKKKNKKILTKESLVSQFATIRTDLKLAASRGVVSRDLFE